MIQAAGSANNLEYASLEKTITSDAEMKLSEFSKYFSQLPAQNQPEIIIDQNLSEMEKMMYEPQEIYCTSPEQSEQLTRDLFFFFKTMDSTASGPAFWRLFGHKMPLLNRIYKPLKSIMPSNASIETILCNVRQMMEDETLEGHLMLKHKY